MGGIIIYLAIIMFWASLMLILVFYPIIYIYNLVAKHYSLPVIGKRFAIIIPVAAILLLIRLGSYESAGAEYVRVEHPMSAKLSSYKSFEVRGYRGSDTGDPAQWLKGKGLESAPPGIKPGLIINMEAKIGSVLTFNWHAGVPMLEKNLKYLEITVKDGESNKIIGQATYERPFYMASMNNPCYAMLNALVLHSM